MNRTRFISRLAALSFIQESGGSRLALAVSLIGGLTGWACGGEEAAAPGVASVVVTSVVVAPAAAALVSLGDTVRLAASARDTPSRRSATALAASPVLVMTIYAIERGR